MAKIYNDKPWSKENLIITLTAHSPNVCLLSPFFIWAKLTDIFTWLQVTTRERMYFLLQHSICSMMYCEQAPEWKHHFSLNTYQNNEFDYVSIFRLIFFKVLRLLDLHCNFIKIPQLRFSSKLHLNSDFDQSDCLNQNQRFRKFFRYFMTSIELNENLRLVVNLILQACTVF